VCTGKKPYYLLSGHPQTQTASELLLFKLTTFKRDVTETSYEPGRACARGMRQGFHAHRRIRCSHFLKWPSLIQGPPGEMQLTHWMEEWKNWETEWCMDEWIDKWVGEWMGEWTDRMSERMDGWVSGWINEWMGEWIEWMWILQLNLSDKCSWLAVAPNTSTWLGLSSCTSAESPSTAMTRRSPETYQCRCH